MLNIFIEIMIVYNIYDWLEVKYLIPPYARPFYSVLYSVITIRYNALELVSEMKIKFGDETHW